MCECFTAEAVKCGGFHHCRCDCHKTLRGQIFNVARATFNEEFAKAIGFPRACHVLAAEFFRTKRQEDEATRAVRGALNLLESGKPIPLLHPGIA